MTFTVVRFLAVALTALALVPGGAHFFELVSKIDLPQEQYFTIQNIYRGWALFGFVWFGALAANLALTGLLRNQPRPFWLALLGSILVTGVLVIFFTLTYPANQATSKWTVAPDNWRALRTQWEYSHAVNALLTFAALCSVTLSALTARA